MKNILISISLVFTCFQTLLAQTDIVNDNFSQDAVNGWLESFKILRNGNQIGAIGTDGLNKLQFFTGSTSSTNTSRLTIDSYGRIGIGVSSPLKKLHLLNNSSFEAGIIESPNQAGSNLRYIDNTGKAIEIGSQYGDAVIRTNSTIRIVAKSDTGDVGIGIPNPSTKLDVNGIISSRNEIRSISSNPAILLNESDVTDKNWHLQVNGGDLKFYEVNDARNSWNQKMIIKSGSGNMAIYGKLEAKEIKVTNTPTADFVFEEDYHLPTLKSIEKHIKEKKHLPEIASAKEMEKNGVNVGNFQIQLLQKIEELTLYTIDQEKEIRELKKRNSKIEKQQKEIEELKKQNSEIKELKALVQKLLKDKN